jgi:four helix bundle protein
MKYDECEKQVPKAITNDPLRRTKAYRLALFAADIGWHDVTKLAKDTRTVSLSDQLYRALGSIGSNLAEGYSRGSGKDRARFYEYALGSARESRNWCYNARHVLGDLVSNHRMELLAQIICLLLTMVPDQRGYSLREEPAAYWVAGSNDLPQPDPAQVQRLLDDIPLP